MLFPVLLSLEPVVFYDENDPVQKTEVEIPLFESFDDLKRWLVQKI